MTPTVTTRSSELYDAAQQVIPGGVNSPVRAFRAVGGRPRFIDHAQGPYLFDADGNRYVDYVLSWGPLILGHAHPQVVDAICHQAARGTSYGAPTAWETELAERIITAMPAVEVVRFVNSGTEATMSALRLARAATGRDKIIKFDGCYHGHADLLLCKAGSGVATLGLPDSPGVPPGTVADTVIAPYNDLLAVESLMQAHHSQIAAIIVEPVAGNMGVIPPEPGFLEGLRHLCDTHSTLLIFDEVMTGFRVHPGGGQVLYGVEPDLTCLGKVIGGGLPVGAYGGRADLMKWMAPVGPVYQAGTLSGNPLAMCAGIVTLDILLRPGVWNDLELKTAKLCQGLGQAAAATGIPYFQTRVGTMFSGFFNPGPITDYASASRSNTDAYTRFFHAMLEQGVYLAPSQFEAGFLSMAHDESVIAHTITAAEEAFQAI